MTGGHANPVPVRVYPVRRTLIVLLLLAPVVWLAGFLRFVDQVPTAETVQEARADAIVVLTGGSRRLAAGFGLLAAGRADRLLVSGVNTRVGAGELRTQAEISDALFACCVHLDYKAKDTLGNAIETAAWVHETGARSVLLVTSNYHMPRSQFELSLLLPDVVIHPYPVFTDQVVMGEWWHHPETLKLLWSEFHKTLLSSLRALLS